MTIVSYQKNFIFIKTNKTAGTSLEIALSKFCGKEDIIGPIFTQDEDLRKSKGFLGAQNFINKTNAKKLNTGILKELVSSFIQLIPLAKKIYKFNYPPNFKFNRKLFIPNFIVNEHTSIKEVEKAVSNSFYNNSFKFTIVRNPYDQFLSYYFWQIHRKKFDPDRSFYDFVKSESYYFFNSELNLLLDRNKKVNFNLIIKYESLEKDLKKLNKEIGIDEDIYEIFKDIKTKSGLKKKENILDDKSKNLIYKNAKFFFEEFGYEH